MLSVLKNRNLRLLFIGSLVSGIGDNFQYIALMAMAYKMTGSATIMGTIMICLIVPNVIMGFFSGVLVDRMNKKWVMIWGNLIWFFITLIPPILNLFGILQVWHLFVYSALFGCVLPFYMASSQAILPEIASPEEYQPMNALFQSSHQIALIVGMSLGGIAMDFFGFEVAYFFDASTFIFAAFMQILIRYKPLAKVVSELVSEAKFLKSWWNDFVDGIKVFIHDKALFILLVTSALSMFVYVPLDMLFMPFTKIAFDAGTKLYGIMVALFGVGMLVGSFVMGVIPPIKNRRAWLFWSSALVGISLVAYAYVRNIPLSCVLILLSGALATPTNVIISTIFQERVPEELRGRVFNTRSTLTTALTPLSLVIAGFVSDSIGVVATVALLGLLGFVTSLPFLSRHLIKTNLE
jgi:MFS family permease